MAKWLKDYLSFGSRRVPPQPPKPDYTESEILKAYRLQKNLDFEDPYEDSENRARNGCIMADLSHTALNSPIKSASMDLKVVSPKHRLIKVDSQDLGRSKILLSTVSIEDPPEPVVPSAPVARDTDYSDPFDARPEPRSNPELEPVLPENNGYMEPYEAQRLITGPILRPSAVTMETAGALNSRVSSEELQRGPGSRQPKGGVQLYDTPYEERGRGRVLHADGGRESRMPQDDERPADEYDQPWEWKKDHISKAFAVQFDSAEWERSLPQTERLRPSKPSPLAVGTSKVRKPVDPYLLLGERVDPTLPLEKQVWYHGALTRSDAEALLTLCKECSYLVRNSQTSHSDYSLSLRSCQGFMHMKFVLSKEGKYILGQNSPPFDTIPEVIHYYTMHKLPIRGAEHMSLLFPVLVQTL